MIVQGVLHSRLSCDGGYMSPLMTHTGLMSEKKRFTVRCAETKKRSSDRVFSIILPSGMFRGHCLGVVVPLRNRRRR